MRKITIGTISMLHPTLEDNEVRSDGPEQLLQEAEKYITEASSQHCDFLCLPEMFANLNRSGSVTETSETLNGPIAKFLSEMALRHRIVLITTISQKENSKFFNTALIYAKNGELAGLYRKVHLPNGDEREVFTPGNDFGRSRQKNGSGCCNY